MSSYSEGQIHQLADALEAVGMTAKHVTRLGQSSALLENIRSVLDGEAVITTTKRSEITSNRTRLLELISTVVIPETIDRFIAKDRLVVNTKRSSTVKISYLGDNFKSWFLSGDGKIEDPISEQTLRYHKLRESTMDSPIITELGGEVKAETTLPEMFFLVEKQKHGEDGVLLNNGYANIFYIRDSAGVLRTVGVYWYGDGWYVGADGVSYPHGWGDGDQVFSRNSVLESSETLVSAQA